MENPPADQADTGLHTGLQAPALGETSEPGSVELEALLKRLEKHLLDMAFSYDPAHREPETSKAIRALQQDLAADANAYTIVVPTDKTNSHRTMDLHQGHLQANGKKVPRSRLVEVHKQALQLLESKRDIMSPKEENYLRRSINSKAIPTPKLLIKDHKKPNEQGHYPTRLVIPADNFTAGIANMGYQAIKHIFDANNVPYMRRTIIQASDLKHQLERLALDPAATTIASIDAVDFYPSVKFKLVQQAVDYYSAGLSQEDRATIKHGLEIVTKGR